MHLLHRTRTPSPKPAKVRKNSTGSNTRFMKFFKKHEKEEKIIKCKNCFTLHSDIDKNKYCFNCGHCLCIQTIHKENIDNEGDKLLKKKLVSFASKRFNLVSEYHKKCKILDQNVIGFIEQKIHIEQRYIENNKALVARFNEESINNKNEHDFHSTLKQLMLNYIQVIDQSASEHQKYLLFLKETEKYLQTEYETMLDFLKEFKEEHDNKLQNVFSKWKDIEYLHEDTQKMNDAEYKEKQSDLWSEWQSFLKDTLKSFPIFMKMRHKKIVDTILSNMIVNEMNMYDQTHCNYLSLWRVIHEMLSEHTEIESFMDYHRDVAVDSLETVIQSLGVETKHTNIDNNNQNEMSKHYGEILRQTRCNGIEWFSSLIFSAKAIKRWNLDDDEWNIVIFEQILCETVMINDKKKWDKAIDCVRNQFEISRKKMNQLMHILMINESESKEKGKYELISLCHRIEVIENINLTDFGGDKKEYKKFIHRQLAFILSCIIWYILESQRTFWNISGSKHNKSDLVQSLHSNMKLVQDFCEEKVNKKDNVMNAAFSPINHLMLMIQEIADGVNHENIQIPIDVPIPNAIYQKMYIEIMHRCFMEKDNDILNDILGNDDEMNDQKRVELNDGWTQIADLLFSLSTKTFMISVNFHCFAFLEFIFDKIIPDNDQNMNPLIMIKPDDNKKDYILLKIIEETFIILMDDVADNKRKEMYKYQEDMYIERVMDKIENKLVKWCSDYKYCNSYTISKFFLFYIFIEKIKNKDIHFTQCYDKLIEFTLITATQLSNELKDKYCGNSNTNNDEELQFKLNNIHNLNKFRIDFLHILHDEMKWHSNLDKYLHENIDKINTVKVTKCHEEFKFIVINDFDNNHAETFLLQWMARFTHLMRDKLQHLKHQDVDKEFLSLTHEINQFILITNQYKARVSIKNKEQWYAVLPPLKKICVFKFKQWVKNEMEPIFKRCVDSVINNEKWVTRSSLRKSSLMLYQMKQHSIISDTINEQLAAKSAAFEAQSSNTHVQYISDNIIDLCTLTDSMTNGCLSFLISFKLHNFADAKSYFKVIQKELNRMCDWVSNDIDQQISMLLPSIPILSRNILNINENKSQLIIKDTEKHVQKNKLITLGIQMHCLDFILSSLNSTKESIEEQYKGFIETEFNLEHLEREIVITLHDENVSQFLFTYFEFISLEYDDNGKEKEGLIICSIKKQSIEYKYDLCIGFQLIKIGDKNCKNLLFDDIIDLITRDYDDIFHKMDLKFKFNVRGVINTLFVEIYKKYNKKLKKIASLISCEIMYNNLYDDLFNKLYHAPLDAHRFCDLNITNKLFKICNPIFEFLNDKNFKLIINDIFNNLRYCICYIFTQTKDVSTKLWIKNDYGLIKDDINCLINTFEDDLDKEYIENRCTRIYNMLEMIKFSMTHLTQHTLPSLQNINANCANNHILYECMLEPHKMLNIEIGNDKKDEVIIRCIQCRLFINIKHKLNEIGYYCCGNEMCLKENMFYCGKCCNKLMYYQNGKTNISKWDLVSILNKKKDNLDDNHSKQFAIKYAQNQCIRSQITMTIQQKERIQENNRRKSKDKKKKKKHSMQQQKDTVLP